MNKTLLAQRFLNNIPSNEFAPLFHTSGNIVKVITKGKKNSYNVLKRSNEIDAIFKSVVHDVRSNDASEGMIYMLFRFEGQNTENKITPLYVGISSRYGKTGDLNSLFGSANSKPRWDYPKGGNYHLSSLSSIVCSGYNTAEKKKDKVSWAESMFHEYPSDEPRLKFIPYLWCKSWTKEDSSIIKELGHTSLFLEEMLLIEIFSSTHPNDLLNKQGNQS